MAKFSSIPAGDQDIDGEDPSFNNAITSSGRSNFRENAKERLSSTAQSVKSFVKDPKASIKYHYVNPKSMKYALGALLLLILTIVAIASSGGSSSSNENPLLDSGNANSKGNNGGSGSENGSGMESEGSSSTDSNSGAGDEGEIPSKSSTWNPTLVSNAVLDSILSSLNTNKETATFPSRIERDVTYLQKTFVTTNTNLTEFDDDGNDIGSSPILEAFVEFDNIMTIKDTTMNGEMIEYEVTRFATDVMNLDGNDYSVDSAATDMDDEMEYFFDSVIGRQSVIKMNKYGGVEYESDEEEYLESLGEIAPGMSAFEQFDQTERMASSLPLNAVKPKDTWQLQMNIKGLAYNGNMQLLGYATYDGAEVAVIEVNAEVSIEEPDVDEGEYYDYEDGNTDDGEDRTRKLKSSNSFKLNWSKSERQNIVRRVLQQRKAQEDPEDYYSEDNSNATDSEDGGFEYYNATDSRDGGVDYYNATDSEDVEAEYYNATDSEDVEAEYYNATDSEEDEAEYYNATDAEIIQFPGLEDDITMRDAVMSGLMFWDTQHAFPRWAVHELSMLIEMSDPYEPGEVIAMPSYEQVEMYMEQK